MVRRKKSRDWPLQDGKVPRWMKPDGMLEADEAYQLLTDSGPSGEPLPAVVVHWRNSYGEQPIVKHWDFDQAQRTADDYLRDLGDRPPLMGWHVLDRQRDEIKQGYKMAVLNTITSNWPEIEKPVKLSRWARLKAWLTKGRL